MSRNRNLIITLIIIVIILIIALTGAIVYISILKGENNKNVRGNSINTNNSIENKIENNSTNSNLNNNTDNNENGGLTNDIENNINSSTPTSPIESGDNQNTTVSDMAQLVFNDKFASYLGNITGAKLVTLIQTVQTNNSTNAEHQVALTSNNMQNLSGVLDTDIFEVTFFYDSQGYINTINIDKKI